MRLLELREKAARWLVDQGVAQWNPGEVCLEEIRGQIADGEWFVVRQAVVVAGLRLLWSDDVMWGHQPPDAVYVHGLVIDRRLAGHGLGAVLLEWVQEQALAADRLHLRLDCVENNHALRNYYARAGFQEVGRRDLDGPWHPAVLLEKLIEPKG